jgi:predicted NUDIX family NTP pyrophosphohydrolase
MKQSGGILVYRRRGNTVEVLLAHPGGPFWAKKNAWSIPKGELEGDEDHKKAAEREFEEELGVKPPTGEWLDLGTTKLSGKTNYIWAVEGDIDLKTLRFGSMVKMEWPPKSGEQIEFPENDRAKWFDLVTSKTKLFKNQQEFIDRLADKLGVNIGETGKPKPGQQQTSLL